ncbi:hypothetical protein PoB_006718300 [Plakobranchus ocellatus]|uniref:Uncharacterized protein n=1 Tax=Plakobranchus ocellatus TaxID=259542 RepID=A0AAV4D8V4_9GAST|nr:hypothetical protein PoB_006718300 [Plakobranchus ocellatus]
MVELKWNDQAQKLGAVATFLDIPVTASPHNSLKSSKGVIHSSNLRCCSEEEMVEELSGVTHARRIKVPREEEEEEEMGEKEKGEEDKEEEEEEKREKEKEKKKKKKKKDSEDEEKE